MVTYLSGSSVKGDTMQTLYLMNPSYTGYNESSNSSSMVLLNPSTGLASQGNTLGTQQQPYAGFSLPPPVSQSSHIAALSNSNIGHHNASPEIFTNRVNSQSYGWNGGNEFLFLPASDMRGDGQSLSARLNPMNAGQNPNSDIVGLRSLSESSFPEQGPFIPSGVGLGLSAENMQASTGAGHILSLSLSPQQPSLNLMHSFSIQHPGLSVNNDPGFTNTIEESYSKDDRFANQWNTGNLNSFRAPATMLGSGIQDSLIRAATNRQGNMLSSFPRVEPYASKYLKPAQQLLIEVVSIARTAKSGSISQTKAQSWSAPSSFGSGFGQDKNLAGTNGKDGGTVASWVNEKDGVSTVSGIANSTTTIPEQNAGNVVDLTAAQRQELQLKKAKLMAMLDEVEQRYRQYHHQMQIVVASFEITAGLAAARTYTALALQTISKHFRCLKDAIRDQIRIACKSLGDEDVTVQGRGETSRLHFIDKQLRQQRALQQLGMMQQHPWRPQRGLPERSVSVLRAWLFEHFLHPYPKDSDKVLLARQTGLTRNQVSNWFINARVRLWKPMVEEMYSEEMKDGENLEERDKSAQGEGENASKRISLIDGAANSETNKLLKHSGPPDSKSEGLLEAKNGGDNFLLQERENSGQGGKRARSSANDSSSFPSPKLSSNLDVKSYDLREAHMLAKLTTKTSQLENYNVPQDTQNLGGYGMFGLNRYANENLAASYPTSTAVSLTLGLQHSEGLSHQSYMHGQGQLQIGGRQEGEINAVNYYGMHDFAGGHVGSYERLSLEDRRRFASHILQQDFT